jgi:hypothetical protein
VTSPMPTDLGAITTQDGYRYQITPTDLLWLARSVQYEGGNELATAWTYAQRQADRRRTGPLFELVQGHSQPVNPKWRRTGEFCRPGGSRASTDACSESRLARRDEAANIPWSALDDRVRTLLTNWAQGRTSNPVPRATDFADPAVSAAFLERPANAGSVVVLRDGNWYIAESRAARWPAGFVQITGPTGMNANSGGAGLVLTAIAAGGAIWYFSRSPRGGLRGTPAKTMRRRSRR